MGNMPEKFDRKLIKSGAYSRYLDFHNLMKFRIRDILLVSSMYDSYIFEEDGRLYELIRSEYQGLNLSHSPELMQVSSGEDALELALNENRFNLILVTLHIEDMKSVTFAKKAREAGIKIPIVLLGYDNFEMTEILSREDTSCFDKIFIWQGDFRLIVGIIKYLEDMLNVEDDTKRIGVQSIIVIEDNILFYSSYLPLIYNAILTQSQGLISEGINLSHKFLRMRARPKILLCSNYEEAWNYFEKYKDCILGVITDLAFTKDGLMNENAGMEFAASVKAEDSDIPILLQSNHPDIEKMAASLSIHYLKKDSPTLLGDLNQFIKQHFSFGDFVFRLEDGKEVGRASNLKELGKMIEEVPLESILYHAGRNHFSNWLKARTEFRLATQLKPKRISDYESPEALRSYLVKEVREFQISRQRGVISDFDKNNFSKYSTFARIGGGSLGGKARGLGFVNRLLSDFEIRNRFEGIEILVPAGIVIATDIFDQFLSDNNLLEFALTSGDDEEINRRFLEAQKIPYLLIRDLMDFLTIVKEPLAVRSSSLLEDSQGQPFAGVYDTYMIPNNHKDMSENLKNLLDIIKLVYASTFHSNAKDYIKVTSYRTEEEKMAVIVQLLTGAKHNGKFYPEISGVAKSYNFYPISPLRPSDGIVSAALGLGKTIVEGGETIRFCPKYPKHLIQFSNLKDTLKYSQSTFYALEYGETENKKEEIKDGNIKISEKYEYLKKYKTHEAEKDGVLSYVGSTYSIENHAVYDGVSRSGPKLFTLAPILKLGALPIPEILDLLLEMIAWGIGSPVEIEFACNFSVEKGNARQFSLLQARPVVVGGERENLDISVHSGEEILAHSKIALGNGLIENINDIITIDPDVFDRAKTWEVAAEIADFNRKLSSEGKKYLLVGMGRWGSLDPWLGIPVSWDQISGAKTIIEGNFRDFNVSPSQGTHFFQNLTSFKVGYFTINEKSGEGFLDWKWLNSLPDEDRKKYSRHIRLEKPLIIKINGQKNEGIIIKPA